MHTIGSAGGYDVYSAILSRKAGKDVDSQSVGINRAVTMVMMVLVVVYCYLMPSDIIAKATSVFMGMTAAALLPAYVHGLYSKTPNRSAAFNSIVAGTAVYLFWALFVNKGTSVFLPICKMLTGKQVLFDGSLMFVDALIIALPVSAIVMAVSLLVLRSKSAPAKEAIAE